MVLNQEDSEKLIGYVKNPDNMGYWLEDYSTLSNYRDNFYDDKYKEIKEALVKAKDAD